MPSELTSCQPDQLSPPIRHNPPPRWFHGSPARIETLKSGSTVTPILELAKAFSHKPPRVEILIEDHDGDGRVTIRHNGRFDGYLYEVLVADPKTDLRQHPTSGFHPGEEMLTTRVLPLRFIELLPLAGSQVQVIDPEKGMTATPAST